MDIDEWVVAFGTAIGRCSVTFFTSPRARVTRVRLPPGDAPTLPASMSLPTEIAEAVARIQALLAGDRSERSDLSGIDLDLSRAPPFHQRVYEVVRRIPRGATMTYGEVATLVGEPGAARAVGQAMGKNPCPIVVPCHRVLAASGRMGGFSAPGGASTKSKMLVIEGALLAE